VLIGADRQSHLRLSGFVQRGVLAVQEAGDAPSAGLTGMSSFLDLATCVPTTGGIGLLVTLTSMDMCFLRYCDLSARH
jgi:hypothetical protein